MNKHQERFFIEETGKFLGKTWIIGPDRESPDFLVEEGPQIFGLEVSEVFTGPKSRSGAQMKERESNTQKIIDALRAKYEKRNNIPLRVLLVGDIHVERMDQILQILIEEDFVSKPILHHVEEKFDDGLSVYVTKALRAESPGSPPGPRASPTTHSNFFQDAP